MSAAMIGNIITVLGLPSITTALCWFYKRIKKNEEKQKAENDAMKLAVQALLRSQMINDYNRWKKKGYAPVYVKDNFENCWSQYHSLGANGVMDEIHRQFLTLPTRDETEEG